MAQPYLISMDHAEWHVKTILRKHAKKRPLGRIESEHRYKPPQPVLSCRTVDVDLTGTRTYRSKSANDIIEEQHKLIHSVYSRARNAKSAPIKRSKIRYDVDSNWRTLRFLTVEGLTSPYSSSTAQRQPSEYTVGRLTKRPFTTGSVRARAKSLTDCHFEPSLYSEIEESSKVFKSVGNLVREQWTLSNHSLDEGQFVRGKNKEGGASLDPKTGNQWLTFAGCESKESSGVVDAFADMKKDVFYRIDGSTGAHVAKQLKKGDKIRICRNGSVVSEDPESSTSRITSQSFTTESFEPTAEQPSSSTSRSGRFSVPLCWTDQVASSDVKILTAREAKDKPVQANINKSSPVVFDDAMKDESWKDYIPKGDGLKGKDLYQIRSRTKPRIGLDGQPSKSSRMTNVTIGKSADNRPVEEVEDLSVEDILEKQLHIKRDIQPKKHPQHLETIVASPRITEEDNSARSDRDLLTPTRSVGGRIHSPRPGSRQEYSVIPSRAMTPQDVNSLVVRNSNTENASKKNISKPNSVHFAKRPIPAKQPLHKTSAAKGVTFAAGSKGVDTSYIQISQKIPMQKERHSSITDMSPQDSNSNDSASALQSENKAEYSNSGINAAAINNTPHESPEPAPGVEINEASYISPPISPPSQYTSRRSNPSPEVQYTINIPTADLADSEVYSLTDFIEKDG